MYNVKIPQIVRVYLFQDNILLLGHSAGAHLGVMAVFELLTKQSLQGPPLPTASIVESMRFEEAYFCGHDSGSNGEAEHDLRSQGAALDGSNASVSSFVVLDQSRTQAELQPQVTRGGAIGAGAAGLGATGAPVAPAPTDPVAMQSMEGSEMGSYVMVRPDQSARSLGNSSSSIEIMRPEEEEEEEADVSSDNGGDASPPIAAQHQLTAKPKRPTSDVRRKMSKSQLEIYNLISSIRGFIGEHLDVYCNNVTLLRLYLHGYCYSVTLSHWVFTVTVTMLH